MKKFLMSFYYAARGIGYAFKGQRNIKVQLFIGVMVVILSLILRIPRIEFAVILIMSFLVIILEMFNCGFERMIDVISPEYHKEFGMIKDIIAGVVLISAVLSVLIGILILGKPLIEFIQGITIKIR